MKMRLCSLVAAGGLVLVSACARQESAREIDWAKAALARNPAYEIVATDESAGVFTVRNTTTGRFETLKLHDLIATPLPPRTAAQPAPAPASPAAEPVESPEAADDSAATLAVEPNYRARGRNGRSGRLALRRVRATASSAATPRRRRSPARSKARGTPSRARIRAAREETPGTPAGFQRRATHRSHRLPG